MTGRLTADERYRSVALPAIWVNVPVGVYGTLCRHVQRAEHGVHHEQRAGQPVRADRPADREGRRPSARPARP